MTRASAITAERQATHGAYRDAARIKRRLVQVVREELARCGKTSWAPDDADLDDVYTDAVEMIMGKIARAIAGDPRHPDHALDIGGYADLIGDELCAARRRRSQASRRSSRSAR